MVNIGKITNTLAKSQTVGLQLGKRNVPRYLYHLTTDKNYQQMLKDGYIKANHDADLSSNLSGVFMLDLRNFTKRWLTTGVDCGDKLLTFAKGLIMQASKDGSNIVALKIPTRKLNTSKLRCRSQVSENNIHHKNGDFATNQKHYARKKEPLEYINEENIPIKNAIKIGEADTGFNLEKALENEPMNYIDIIDEKKILQNLFKNTPEEKCINLVAKQNTPILKNYSIEKL